MDAETLRGRLNEAAVKKGSQWGGAQRLLLTGPKSMTDRLNSIGQLVNEVARHEATILPSEGASETPRGCLARKFKGNSRRLAESRGISRHLARGIL